MRWIIYYGDRTTYSDPTLAGTCDTFQSIRYQFSVLGWGTQQTIGYRFRVLGVKIRTTLS